MRNLFKILFIGIILLVLISYFTDHKIKKESSLKTDKQDESSSKNYARLAKELGVKYENDISFAIWVSAVTRSLKEQKRYQEVLELHEKVLGKEHPDLVASINDLANLYKIDGNFVEAESMFKKALDLIEKTFNNNHPFKATILKNYADLYNLQGRELEANSLFTKLLELKEKKLINKGIPQIEINRLNSIKVPIWKESDIKWDIQDSYTYEKYDTRNPPYYNNDPPFSYLIGKYESIIVFHKFRNFINIFVDPISLIKGAITKSLTNNKIVAEAKIRYYTTKIPNSNKYRQERELEEYHYDENGDLIFHCKSLIDPYSGFKIKEMEMIGKKEIDYYFLWPIN